MSLSGGSMDLTSSNTDWIWAIKTGSPVHSDSESADLSQVHEGQGTYFQASKQSFCAVHFGTGHVVRAFSSKKQIKQRLPESGGANSILPTGNFNLDLTKVSTQT